MNVFFLRVPNKETRRRHPNEWWKERPRSNERTALRRSDRTGFEVKSMYIWIKPHLGCNIEYRPRCYPFVQISIWRPLGAAVSWHSEIRTHKANAQFFLCRIKRKYIKETTPAHSTHLDGKKGVSSLLCPVFAGPCLISFSARVPSACSLAHSVDYAGSKQPNYRFGHGGIH